MPEPDEPEEGYITAAAGTVVEVIGPHGIGKWEGKEVRYVQVKPDRQSHIFARVSDLEATPPPLSEDQTAELLFREVPQNQRAWCSRHTRRIWLLSPMAGADMVAFSSSADEACYGWMALLAMREGKPVVLQSTRRGPLQSIFPRFVNGDALLDVLEGIHGRLDQTGVRRVFLNAQAPGLQELLAVDVALDEVSGKKRRSISSVVELEERGDGLVVRTSRTEMQISLVDGAESAVRKTNEGYLLRGGKVSSLTVREPEGQRLH